MLFSRTPHRTSARSSSLLLLCAGLTAVSAGSARAQTERDILNQVAFDQRLDQQVPLELRFKNEHGKDVRLGELIDDKPVVLSLVYYECPMLCTQVLNGLVRALAKVDLEPGDDFEIITVSIDPKETPELAAEKERVYLRQLGDPSAANAWHFLVGNEENIRSLADAVGFRYVYDQRIDEYAHPAGLVVLTPKGRVSRYLFDLEHGEGASVGRDLRFALMESAEERIGSLLQQVVLRCYHYDPTSGKYGVAIANTIRLLGAVTVGALFTFMFVSLRRERRLAREAMAVQA